VTSGGSSSRAAGSATRPDERFRPEERIRRRAEYVAVYDRGRKIGGRLMTVFLLENSLSRPRLGIAATRKFGSAVQRNRAKRRLREALARVPLRGDRDYLVIAGEAVPTAPFGALVGWVAAAVEELR